LADKPLRSPNAYKHGGFSKTVLFPWEDADEFDALHRSLQDEWEPSGALEEDAVYTILTCIWRKRRIRDKRNLDILAALQREDLEALTKSPIPFFDTGLETSIYVAGSSKGGPPRDRNKVSQLLGFSSSLYRSLNGQFLELSINMLGGEPSAHLKREVPKGNYSTTPEWVQAVKREVDDVLLPRARAEMESPNYLAAKARPNEVHEANLRIKRETVEERADAADRRTEEAKTAKEQ
jgi:hypothetical protein